LPEEACGKYCETDEDGIAAADVCDGGECPDILTIEVMFSANGTQMYF
jgi:hypothetical protein